MNPLTPKGLEQSPQKKVEIPKLQKVEVGEAPQINASINLLDVIRLGIRKGIENKAFEAFQKSTGVQVPSAVGFGFLGSIDWIALATGSILEWVKLIISVVSLAVGWVGKK